MVTLRRSMRHVIRSSTSAAKSSIPAKSAPHQPVPVTNSSTEPSVLVVATVVTLLPSFQVPVVNPSPILAVPEISHPVSFDFNGIQYSPYFLTSGDNPGTSLISEVLD